jgi:hypothetical protein
MKAASVTKGADRNTEHIPMGIAAAHPPRFFFLLLHPGASSAVLQPELVFEPSARSRISLVEIENGSAHSG